MLNFRTKTHIIRITLKAGSSTLARAVIRDLHPDIEARIQSAHYPKGKGPDNGQWHSFVPRVKNEERGDLPVVTLIRDPVERFISALAQVNVTDVESAIASLETGSPVKNKHRELVLIENQHFFHQSRNLPNCRLYRFPDHIEDLAKDVGLTLPLPVINEARRKKVTLTAEQEERVRAFYADDQIVFDSISKAGEDYAAPVIPLDDHLLMAKKHEIGQRRYQAEFAGFTDPDSGVLIRTDTRSRSFIASAATKASTDPTYTIKNWKQSNGTFITMSASAIIALEGAISRFIEDLFTKEAHLCSLVDEAATEKELAEISW